jgi:hypothetical protein
VGLGSEAKAPRRLRLRYPATCPSCGLSLSKGAEAVWDPEAKAANCLACLPFIGVNSDRAGASAAAEGTRRVERKVNEVRRMYGDHAAEVAREMAGRDAAASWGKGSEGALGGSIGLGASATAATLPKSPRPRP